MRRRSHLIAALGAGGLVVLCALTVGVAVAAASPRAAAVDTVDARIPPDLVWTWVAICEAKTAEASGVPASYSMSMSTDAEGRMSVEYAIVDDDGNMTPDVARTAVMDQCLSTRRAEADQTQFGTVSYPGPTQAQRLGLYDWAVRDQQPCLAAHGIDTIVPPLEQFLDDQYIPWYLLEQYIWASDRGPVDVDFDALLAARLACPPVPAFLAAQGVGW